MYAFVLCACVCVVVVVHFDSCTSNFVVLFFLCTVRSCASCHSPPTSVSVTAATFADNVKILSMKRRRNQDRLGSKERNSYEKLDWNVW